MGLFDKFKRGLAKTARQLTSNLGALMGEKARLSDGAAKDLEERLVSTDMGLGMAQSILGEVQERLEKTGKNETPALPVLLREMLIRRLSGYHTPWELARPSVVLLVGVNGAGKTTTAGKLGARYSGEGRKVLLAAGDTFRAAAEEQLTSWAERAKVELVRGSHGAASSAVVFDAIKSGLQNGSDCVIVDTAGRLHNRSNLMEELKKIARVAEKAAPGIRHEKWLVLDANTGQNALNQTRDFHLGMGLTGLVITKLDGTAKGGIVVNLCEQEGLPVRFLGVGEGIEDTHSFRRENVR